MADTPTPKYATRAEAIAALTAPGQFYELEQLTIRGRSLRVFKNAPASLRELFADAFSDKTFIVYETDRLTFAEAWARAGRIGGLLVRDYGVQPGDRVAISMRNYPEWI
ncbi:MAG: AMP-binding protein, partial [Alphaproteobacteria bacterium]